MTDKPTLNQTIQALLRKHSHLETAAERLLQDPAAFLQHATDQDFRLKFLCTLIAAQPKANEHIAKFAGLLDGQFREFCDQETGINSVQAYVVLHSILAQLRRINECPQLFNKKLCAIGGVFSAGKSAFVNSFLKAMPQGISLLSEGNQPVTAIPNYVIASDETFIQGISFQGGSFNIEPADFKRINHNFVRSFNFDLKSILQYTTVRAPLNEQYFKNICLIDTPGINAPCSASTARDTDASAAAISNAEALLWIIGITSNGTTSAEQLEFLQQFDFGREDDKPLYIVANKADLRPLPDVESIMDEIAESLENAGFYPEGIQAFSSQESEDDYTGVFLGKSLYDFLTELNQPQDINFAYVEKINQIMLPYAKHIQDESAAYKSKFNNVRMLMNKFAASGAIDLDDEHSSLEDALYDLSNEFKEKKGFSYEDRITRMFSIKDSLLEALNGFFKEHNLKSFTHKQFCMHCGQELNAKAQYCPRCGYALDCRSRRCPECLIQLPQKAMTKRFCFNCGSPLI